MKIKDGFVIRTVGDRKIAVPIGRRASEIQGLVSLNDTAAAIWEILQKEQEEKDVVECLLQQYDADRWEVEECVHSFIEEMEEKGVLER